LRVPALQHQQLLPQAEILRDQQHPRPERRRNRPDQKANHPPLRSIPVVAEGPGPRLSTAKPLDGHSAPHSLPTAAPLRACRPCTGPRLARSRHRTSCPCSKLRTSRAPATTCHRHPVKSVLGRLAPTNATPSVAQGVAELGRAHFNVVASCSERFHEVAILQHYYKILD
jgi:hypothetical protein